MCTSHLQRWLVSEKNTVGLCTWMQMKWNVIHIVLLDSVWATSMLPSDCILIPQPTNWPIHMAASVTLPYTYGTVVNWAWGCIHYCSLKHSEILFLSKLILHYESSIIIGGLLKPRLHYWPGLTNPGSNPSQYVSGLVLFTHALQYSFKS